ncbi:MAG: aldehyde dehydrogenase family protein [Parcubacteria group bacterium]|nr:aldehyde dehydrogenase family protein [Parcubacteria group bacterium]
MQKRTILRRLGIHARAAGAYAGYQGCLLGRTELPSINPATGKPIAKVVLATQSSYEEVVEEARRAFLLWRRVPAPQRGLLIRDIADELRRLKKHLGALVSLETGKIIAEGEGEVQEMIDIADFAVGLSRQLYGLTIASERPEHSMRETWLPLGIVGVITAFNFPVAVWAWNAFIAAVCGDTVVWKPSLKAPLTAIAVQNICNRVCARHGAEGVFNLCIGSDHIIGELLIHDPRIPLISATGSTKMGRHVGMVVAERFGRTILELGGNNAVIVMDDANLDQAVRAILFGAVGTAGERCTTTRRVIAHRAIFEELEKRLLFAFQKIKVGNPFDPGVLTGPLIDATAVQKMMRAIERIKDEGGTILYGGEHLGGNFVSPALVRAHPGMPILKEEVFAPILYLLQCEPLEEAIVLNNSVPQGLSSALFTEGIRNAEFFLSSEGSDCGLANVNTGTSGAEIGGAFGGEKATGGGREAGSNAWQAYMRRQTSVVNWSGALPLAQGLIFGD